jgi:cell shape-determining protein MreC
MGKMTEEKFVELMERIPVMEEKLNALLFAFEKISKNQNSFGIITNSEFPPFTFSEKAAQDHELIKAQIEKKRREAEKLQQEANELRDKLDF